MPVLKLFEFKSDPNSSGILSREFTKTVSIAQAQTEVQKHYDSPYHGVHVDTLRQYPNTIL